MAGNLLRLSQGFVLYLTRKMSAMSSETATRLHIRFVSTEECFTNLMAAMIGRGKLFAILPVWNAFSKHKTRQVPPM